MELEKSLKKGLAYLKACQLPSGEFLTFRESPHQPQSAIQVKSVFITTFVLHSLKHLRQFPGVDGIASKALAFLLAEREESGLWRFFGRGSPVPADVDCTCCAAASLLEWGIELDHQTLLEKLLPCRLDGGAFWTWIPRPGDLEIPNDIDWVVNANAVLYFSSLGHRLPGTEEYLREIVRSGLFRQPSVYYPSPLAFAYCFTRALHDGDAKGLSNHMRVFRDCLLSSAGVGGGWPTALEKSLGLASLVNCGETNLERLLLELVGMQSSDGSWDDACFFVDPFGGRYSSRALTTAVAVEGIVKLMALQDSSVEQ